MAEYLALCNSNFTFRKCFSHVQSLWFSNVGNPQPDSATSGEKDFSLVFSRKSCNTVFTVFPSNIWLSENISISVFAGIISMNSSYQRNFNMLSFQQFNLLFGWTTFFTTCWLLHNELFTNLMNDGSNGDLNCKVLWRNGCVIFEITVSFLSMLL